MMEVQKEEGSINSMHTECGTTTGQQVDRVGAEDTLQVLLLQLLPQDRHAVCFLSLT